MSNAIYKVWVALVHGFFDTNISIFGLLVFFALVYAGARVGALVDKLGRWASWMVDAAVFVVLFVLLLVFHDLSAAVVFAASMCIGLAIRITRTTTNTSTDAAE